MSGKHNRDKDTQEQELWDRIVECDGTERAEVLDELSHIAYHRDDYTQCLQLLESSIEIYYKHGLDNYVKELIHLYEGKALALRNLERYKDSADTFEELAKLHQINEDDTGFIRAKRAAACDWFEAEEWQQSLDSHCIARDALDADATPFTMGVDLLNIATAQSELDLHTEALENYIQSRKYFKEIKNPEMVNWCDRYMAKTFLALENGPEAKFYAQHFHNFATVSKNAEMEGYASYLLGKSQWLCFEFDEAKRLLEKALTLLTSQEDKDWDLIVKANKALAAVLISLGSEKESVIILERLKTIEETINP